MIQSNTSGSATTEGTSTDAVPSARAPESAPNAALIDQAVEAVRRICEPEEQDLATRFTRHMLRKAPREFFHERSMEELAALSLHSFRFVDRKGSEPVDVELVNPELEDRGWHAPVTVIRTSVTERPFIVDTIRELLHDQEHVIERFVYPVFRVVRGEDGAVTEIGPAAEGEPRESFVYCEIGRIGDAAERDRLGDELTRHLRDVVRSTDDFDPMLESLTSTITRLSDYARQFPDRAEEIKEIQAFLRWLREGAFVFLGYRAYDIVDDDSRQRALVVEPGSGLGILRNEGRSSYAEPIPVEQLPAGLRERVLGGPLLIISKSNARSTVHRRVRMDYVGVKKLDEQGRVAGENRFLGLFTSQAYSEDAEQIPILRQKLHRILQEAGVMKGSHDYKEIITIFNSMPKEELFLTSAEQIGSEIQAVLNLYHTHEVKVTIRPDPLQRGVSVMAVLPKEKFSGDVRKQIEAAFVDRFEGEVLNYHLALGGGDQARLHFYISSSAERIAEVQPEQLEQIVADLIRSWTDRVRVGLEEERTAEDARRLAQRYGRAFSPEYRAAIDPDTAERDILELESMAHHGRDVSIRLSNTADGAGIAAGEAATQLTLFLRDRGLILSDFMPILENVGLRVLAMSPFEVGGTEVPDAKIYVFAVQDEAGRPVEITERGGQMAEAVLAVRAGDALNDSLNALVLTAGLRWRQIDVLRAYSEYAFQMGLVPSRLSLPNALRSYPDAAQLLVRLFRTKFDPTLDGDIAWRSRTSAEIREGFILALESVGSLADDRALRRLLALMEATVRTNYYLRGGDDPTARSGGAPYLSLKFSAEMLEGISRSGLLYEVWVHSSRMAGVHLRGARVARGGIRHSDRPDDFRTEVLGLVKTQMVKNAVIVPGGSKGGFIVRPQRNEPRPSPESVADQYRTLIRGLLDITDNLVDGEVRRPSELIVYDDADPYLVVAADKGTAHLSDVANGVAEEYDFWLGDAFASGGSHGYDHKKVGITAKGAWECVRRHFREIGIDIQAEPFTVAGIGDMSGDVFGNGMLLSRQIRLIAAFDHRHIFVDPDPDAAASYQERERLFAAGRTSWDDYDHSVMSEGGFIVPRGIKEVVLTPQAREALGIDPSIERLDGESLIQAILRAPVDLLWNGGIGTYVKASFESHGDVGDSANDAVRINAPELRARVVGEGGNLGFTQAGRIQYALDGGRLNTDAVDNAGGVDMSDHEVNLKILFNQAIARGRLDSESRNALLEELTPAVTELVLRDNRSQSLAVSLDEIRTATSLEDFQALMPALERERLLDRKREGLPSLEELGERRQSGRSLTRPELSVLLAYAKLSTKRHLLASGLPDDPATGSYLVGYFPAKAVATAGSEALENHRLRREIVVTQLVNDLVDLMGAPFVHRLVRDTGHTVPEVVRAWLIAARLSGADELRSSLESLEGELPSGVVYRWLLGLSRVLERTTRWVLGNVSPDAPTADVIEQHLEGLASVRGNFPNLVAGEDRRLFEQRVGEIQELTAKHDLAQRLITLRFLDHILEILRVAREVGVSPVDAGRVYYRVAELLHVSWLRQAVFETAGDDRWDQRVAQGLADDLGRAHRLLTEEVLRSRPGGSEDLLERVREKHGRELAEYLALFDEVTGDDRCGLAALSVLVRQLNTVVGPA